MQPAIIAKQGRSSHFFFQPAHSFTQVADISLITACSKYRVAVGGGTAETAPLRTVMQSGKIASGITASIAVWIPNGYHVTGNRSLVMLFQGCAPDPQSLTTFASIYSLNEKGC